MYITQIFFIFYESNHSQAAAEAASLALSPPPPEDPPPSWKMPDALLRHLEQERAELMRCLDEWAQHVPLQHPEPPAAPVDRVRTFLGASGVGDLSLRKVKVKDALLALNGEGGEGPAFTRGASGYRNAVFEQQDLDRRLGVRRREHGGGGQEDHFY